MATLKETPIVPCLWFNGQAEEAALFYTRVFPGSGITGVSRHSEIGHEYHGMEPGAALTVAFHLKGQPMTALNGGPQFKFNEAISLQVLCETQDEIDHYWERLSAGGDPTAQQCGWLKDKYGVSWQIVPACLESMMQSPDPGKPSRVMAALFEMKKLDIAQLDAAFAG